MYHGEGHREYLLALEVWNSEKHLHDRVEVAAVAQIFHASQARAKQRLQGGPRLLDHLPLPHALVHSNLQLCHCPLSLTSDERLRCKRVTDGGYKCRTINVTSVSITILDSHDHKVKIIEVKQVAQCVCFMAHHPQHTPAAFWEGNMV